MIIDKHTVTITVEVADRRSVVASVQAAMEQFDDKEALDGFIRYADGDQVEWHTKFERHEI